MAKQTKGAGKGPAKRSRKPAKASAGVTAAEREQMVAEAAYYKAEQRGFSGSSAEEDWLEAADEIDAMLATRPGGRRRPK